LEQFKEKFKDMRLGELVSYSDKDIEDLCEEFGIKMPYKKRLADAIHVLQANKKQIQLDAGKENAEGGDAPVARTMISAEEENAFDNMTARHSEVNQCLLDTNTAIITLKESHSKAKKEINGAFDKIITKLNNRRQQLIERLNYEGNKKMAVIKDNKEKLTNYKQSIESCQSDANKLTLDVTMDRRTRKFRILQIEKYVFKYAVTNEVGLHTKGHIDDNFLRFDCKSETAAKAFHFIQNYGHILVNEVPDPPLVNMVGIGVTRCKIRFAVDPNMSASVDKPKEWIVEYKTYTKPKPRPQTAPADDQKNGDGAPAAPVGSHTVADAEADALNLDDIGTENQWTPKVKLKDTNEYILDGLKANTAYSIRVTCSNHSGWSDYSKILNFTTKPIEGGIDSKIMTLEQKNKLKALIAHKLNVQEEEKANVQHGANRSRGSSISSMSSRHSFLGGMFGGKKTRHVVQEQVAMQLLYRGSKHGFEASAFHEKCDFMDNTVVVVQTKENGNVFGGYTAMPWKSPQSFQFIEDRSAFLFLLANYANPRDKARLFEIGPDETQYAVCHDPKYGPIFGNGYSLCLYDKCNEVNKNYTNPVSFNFREKPNQLSGRYNFTVKEYEVFQVSIKSPAKR